MTMSEAGDVVKRMTVTMDDDLYEFIDKKAKAEERTVPNYLVWLARKHQQEEQADTAK